ncbi:hypothetical protein HHK36_003119 [Tetracentron sinense]|uniref:DUF7798 domain-containing protein n=1 Tax=Tetracentron sinense TaxID=13715 RepID=A0A834ZXR0_TETSI|nr:hypothetical protein HHK36_003119 [Tetracentron sinense]
MPCQCVDPRNSGNSNSNRHLLQTKSIRTEKRSYQFSIPLYTSKSRSRVLMEENTKSPTKKEPEPATGGGWGGWGFSPFSVLSDLQKAAIVAGEEISRNAVAVAKTAAKGIADMQIITEDSESSKEEEETEESATEGKNEDENDKLRKSTLEKLEKASEDSLLGQASHIYNRDQISCLYSDIGAIMRYCTFVLLVIFCESASHPVFVLIIIACEGLKVVDSSVENLASGAWQALGSAWKGGSNLVHKLEHSAANLAESIQHSGLPVAAGSAAPSLIESGKAFTTKGMQVLERVGKETMELLIAETGIEVDKNPDEAEQQANEEQLFEDVTFDRCFYIYGGPEQLEELEALSNHYTLLFNRRKTKLSSEQKSVFDGKLRQVQQIFNLSTEIDGSGIESDKGKKIETIEEGSGDEMKILCDSSVSKAADMAAGFTSSLVGLAANEIIQRTADRLETIHSEGVHRLSELCCFAVSQLLMLGKSIISISNKVQNEDADQDMVRIDWPEDSIEKAKIIRLKAQSMTGDVEAVSNSFITGISDVAESYQAAIKGATADAHEGLPQTSIQEKANAILDHLRADQSTAMDKLQDGLQYLSFVVLSTSMPPSA